MKLNRSKEWWSSLARREPPEVAIAAGLPTPEPIVGAGRQATTPPTSVDELRVAFGRFVNLMRRRQSLSVEELAEKADLDVSELLIIEDDIRYVPEPRTVYKLAQTFRVPQQRLMQVAGLAAARDVGLKQEAVRFAARSESVHRLSKEESAALDAFVVILSRQEPEKRGK